MLKVDPAATWAKRNQWMHECQLARVIQFQSGDAFAIRQYRVLGELAQLPPIDEGFQNVLLDVLIVVVNRCELATQLGKIFDGLLHPIIVDVVGGRLGAQDEVVANVLLDEAVGVMAADDRVGQVHIFDFGLQFSAMAAGNLAAKELVGKRLAWHMFVASSLCCSPQCFNDHLTGRLAQSQIVKLLMRDQAAI